MTNMIYQRNSETISGRLHDELVMMDIQKGKYFSLNQVATQIWDLLEKPTSLDEICNTLMAEYDIKAEQCISNVQSYLNEMQKLGLVISGS